MPVSWVEHRGHDILYVDYRGLGPSECLDTLHDQVAAIEGSAEPVRTLVDGRGASFSGEFMRVAKAAAPRNTVRTIKRAAVGAEGIKEMLLTFFNVAAAPVPLKAFGSVAEALDYLTEP
jgi:hypothetical protein